MEARCHVWRSGIHFVPSDGDKVPRGAHAPLLVSKT